MARRSYLFVCYARGKVKPMNTRREFMGHLAKGAAGVAILGAGGTILEGCNLFAEIGAWVPVGISVFQSALTLLTNAGLVNPGEAAIANIIIAAFNQVLADAKQYEAINPPPAGAKAKLEAALQIIVNNFQNFLAALNLPTTGNLETLVVGFAQIILDAISGFISQLGVTSVTMAAKFQVGPRSVVTPKPVVYRYTGSFKKAWNREAEASGYPELKQHLTFLEHFA
jgi:hypothetical protein